MRKKKLKEAAQLENDTLDRFPPHGDVPFESLPIFIITTKDPRKGGLLLLAEQVRFELTDGFRPSHDFQSCPL